MNLKSPLVALLMLSVTLAGCTDGEGPGGDGDDIDPAEDPTKGHIRGLLVDDNFRPVQLKEDWSNGPGEFQDKGFILLVETAERFETSANGEFEVMGLDPGRYTLRVAADAHEAIEQKIEVTAGQSAPVTLEARRLSSASNPVLTIEYSGFIPCATGGIVSTTAGFCAYDLSGDSYRPGPIEDYRALYGTDAHYIVIEAVTNQPGEYSLEFRDDDPTDSDPFAYDYASSAAADPDNPYMKVIAENSEVYPEHNPRFKGQNDGSIYCPAESHIETHEEGDYCSWNNFFPEEDDGHYDLSALVFYTGEEYGDAGPFTVSAGGKAGLKINYVVSIFLGEPTPTDETPENDLNEYCVYCKGYLDEL